MNRFKVGDIVKVASRPDSVQIWVKCGKEYEVLGIERTPPEPANKCYRDCGHPMHDEKPEKFYVKLNGEMGLCTIWEGCFE
jgi:hypothetical protein